MIAHRLCFAVFSTLMPFKRLTEYVQGNEVNRSTSWVVDVIVGMATQLAPLYLAEISPYNLRGMFGTANQLFITIGIFVASVFGLAEILGKFVCLLLHALVLTPSHQLSFYFNPFTPAVPNCCCSKGSAPYWSNPPFFISDIRALWRSRLSTRAPECQKLIMVG